MIALSVLGEGAVGLAGLVAEQAAHAREAGQVVRLHVAFHGAPVPVLEGTHAAEEDTTYSTGGCSLLLATLILQKSTFFKASVQAPSRVEHLLLGGIRAEQTIPYITII